MVIKMPGDGTPDAVYDLPDGPAPPEIPAPLIPTPWGGTRVDQAQLDP